MMWALALAACSSGGGGGAHDATAADARPADGAPADARSGDAAVTDAAPDARVQDAAPDAQAPDAAPLPALSITPTIAAAPPDPLAGAAIEGCAVYQDERCAAGRQQRCDLFDTTTGAFVDAPDPLLRRAFLYDRWYDRYHSPDGQTAERLFRGPVPGDAPEAAWGAPENFAGWDGAGDSAIWTGAALTADVFRYAVTGTEADYRRMEDKVRALLLDFDVTGVPGYLARFHYLRMPPGGPDSDAHIVVHADTAGSDLPVAEAALAALPAAYRDGLPGPDGALVRGEALWHGNPSIDQYSGSWVGLPLAWPLLRDPALKARIVEHLTCYLKRLRRVEIVHLQSNAQLRDALTSFLGQGSLRLDPDDIDLLGLDRIVGYYQPNLNPANADTFDRTCPDHVATEPTLVIDAAAPNWLAQLTRLALDLASSDPPRATRIDHMYVPSVRGGDASHLMQMATVAWWMTGDDQYRRFLFDELIGNIQADRVLMTMEAFRNPDFCFKFYGDHITYGTHWQLATLLRTDPLHALLARAMHEELWEKGLRDHRNAKFELMYAVAVGGEHADVRDLAVADAVDQLRAFGGNGGTLDAPRRTYTRDRQAIIDALPEGVTVRCPTEEERARCEAGITLFGVQFESSHITHDCDGRPGECVMNDGQCVDGIASAGLPVGLRRYADFLWQRGPYDLGESVAVEGAKQSPGRDLSEEYWMARYYGFLPEGRGQVLAWRDEGACQ